MGLHLETVVWDNHACMPLRPGDAAFLPQLNRVKQAGVDVVTLNIACGKQTFQHAHDLQETFRNWVLEHSDAFEIVHTASDIHRIKRAGKMAICFDVEGGDALDNDASNVERLYALGVRWMLPTYNKNNALGGGCLDQDSGLTEFGRNVVAEMNRVGMVVCGSHCGAQTAQDLLDVSAAPVIFSHSNAHAVCPHPRNISDDLMRQCADTGGVVGLCGFSLFLGDKQPLHQLLAAHMDHALRVAGEDHVGLALDYVFDREELDAFIADNPDVFPPTVFHEGAAMMHHEDLPVLHDVLLQKGWSSRVLEKVFGLNHVRLAQDVWKAPARA
ncbi:MAG: membrane dipeptidase [Pseudomonadota bacterium]